MNKWERIQSVFLYGVFICYNLLLIKILFLSRVSIWELFDSQRSIMRSINLIPFYSISEFISGGSANLKDFAFANVAGNILIFIPVGGYLALFKNKKNAAFNLLTIVIVSLLVEIIQGLLGIGTADIDDVILNSLGGWIGIMGYKLLRFVLRDEMKAHVVITILSAVVVLPAIYYYLFMIKMRF
ncbi:VanZ family protein [Paenibacillus aurantiacus]|uniref:VanZ family protein n=1 Tax=Paenibacillus aurantiacus TaxID=1936118 RepID=A0ABV5KPF9_9BACL